MTMQFLVVCSLFIMYQGASARIKYRMPNDMPYNYSDTENQLSQFFTEKSNEILPNVPQAQDPEKLKNMVAQVASEVKELRGQMRSLESLNYLVYKTVKKVRSQLSSKGRSRRRCPKNFVYNPSSESCYLFMAQRTTWKDARKRCQAVNADLVSINTDHDQSFIRKTASANRDLQHCDFWTGATDARSEGKWTWVGTGKPATYTYWNYNEPNNVNGIEHCMKMMWVFRWRWNDAHCNINNACFICETKQAKMTY